MDAGVGGQEEPLGPRLRSLVRPLAVAPRQPLSKDQVFELVAS